MERSTRRTIINAYNAPRARAIFSYIGGLCQDMKAKEGCLVYSWIFGQSCITHSRLFVLSLTVICLFYHSQSSVCSITHSRLFVLSLTVICLFYHSQSSLFTVLFNVLHHSSVFRIDTGCCQSAHHSQSHSWFFCIKAHGVWLNAAVHCIVAIMIIVRSRTS